jgi:hypothetical protein
VDVEVQCGYLHVQARFSIGSILWEGVLP